MSPTFRVTNGHGRTITQTAGSMQSMLRRIADALDRCEEQGKADAKAFSVCKVEQIDA